MTHLICWPAAEPRSPVGCARAVAAYRRAVQARRRVVLAGDYLALPWTDGAADARAFAATAVLPASSTDRLSSLRARFGCERLSGHCRKRSASWAGRDVPRRRRSPCDLHPRQARARRRLRARRHRRLGDHRRPGSAETCGAVYGEEWDPQAARRVAQPLPRTWRKPPNSPTHSEHQRSD
jgi:hypothetical protein